MSRITIIPRRCSLQKGTVRVLMTCCTSPFGEAIIVVVSVGGDNTTRFILGDVIVCLVTIRVGGLATTLGAITTVRLVSEINLFPEVALVLLLEEDLFEERTGLADVYITSITSTRKIHLSVIKTIDK
jgi:hypothetical protein